MSRLYRKRGEGFVPFSSQEKSCKVGKIKTKPFFTFWMYSSPVLLIPEYLPWWDPGSPLFMRLPIQIRKRVRFIQGVYGRDSYSVSVATHRDAQRSLPRCENSYKYLVTSKILLLRERGSEYSILWITPASHFCQVFWLKRWMRSLRPIFTKGKNCNEILILSY